MIEKPWWQKALYALEPIIKRIYTTILFLIERIYRATVEAILSQLH